MFVHLSFVSLHVVCKCDNIYILRFGKLNKLYYIKLFIMNKQFYFSSEYVAPEVEVISAVVEHGFSASFGDFGEAGDGFDIEDNGDF